MAHLKFNSLEEAFECYGRDQLVPIDNLKQCIFYIKNGVQPCFVWEKETEINRLTCWFLKSETRWIYKRWQENKPEK